MEGILPNLMHRNDHPLALHNAQKSPSPQFGPRTAGVPSVASSTSLTIGSFSHTLDSGSARDRLVAGSQQKQGSSPAGCYLHKQSEYPISISSCFHSRQPGRATFHPLTFAAACGEATGTPCSPPCSRACQGGRRWPCGLDAAGEPLGALAGGSLGPLTIRSMQRQCSTVQ